MRAKPPIGVPPNGSETLTPHHAPPEMLIIKISEHIL